MIHQEVKQYKLEDMRVGGKWYLEKNDVKWVYTIRDVTRDTTMADGTRYENDKKVDEFITHSVNMDIWNDLVKDYNAYYTHKNQSILEIINNL